MKNSYVRVPTALAYELARHGFRWAPALDGPEPEEYLVNLRRQTLEPVRTKTLTALCPRLDDLQAVLMLASKN